MYNNYNILYCKPNRMTSYAVVSSLRLRQLTYDSLD